jgi:hypothetical protein
LLGQFWDLGARLGHVDAPCKLGAGRDNSKGACVPAEGFFDPSSANGRDDLRFPKGSPKKAVWIRAKTLVLASAFVMG